MGWDDHWRRAWLPTAVFLPRESHILSSLAGYCLWGRRESDTTEQLTLLTFHLARFSFRMSRRVGISVSAGAAIICSLTGSESCTSNACPCVCWQEASLTRPTGPSLHTAAHSMVFSSEWSGEGEHAQDGSHRCRTVILSLLLFTVGPTRQLWSSVGGYIMEA